MNIKTCNFIKQTIHVHSSVAINNCAGCLNMAQLF